jgi:crossover junction endodeoxyribonuclease RusA
MRQVVIADFMVDGEPVSKERARITGRGTYTPVKTVAAEARIAWGFRQAAKGWKVDDTSEFIVGMSFFLSTRRRRDIDNMMKLVMDALNGVCWKDDSQVVEAWGRKHVSKPPGTGVAVWRLEPYS